MTQAHQRVLLVAPLSDSPWCSIDDLAAALQSLGHETLLAAYDPEAGQVRLPVPVATASSRASVGGTAPAIALMRGRAYARWLRALRTTLQQANADAVVVWDPYLAIGVRLARPRSARVVWVVPEQFPVGRAERFQRAAITFAADTVVVSRPDATMINLARHVLVPPLAPPGTVRLLATGWVVLDTGYSDAASQVALQEMAKAEPARAVVADARQGLIDNASANALADACDAKEIWLDHDDSWLEAFPVATVVDPSTVIPKLDHRHRAALAAGAALLVRQDAALGTWSLGATPEPCDEFWQRITPQVAVSTDVRDWASRALTDPLHPRAAVVASTGVEVARCPACHSTQRSPARRVGPTTVLTCHECGLSYGSPKVPDGVVYDAGYHDGTGEFGTDYVRATWYCERLSDDRLQTLADAAVPRGRLLDIGTGLGHFVARARQQGWDADGLELVDAAVARAKELYGLELIEADVFSFRPATRYDVVALGQTLEHFVDVQAVLTHIHDHVLRPGGHLLVEVPNVGGLPRRLRGSRWSHWQSGDHVSYFDRTTMRRALERTGFEAVHTATLSGVFAGLGTVGTLYALGVLDPTAAWFSGLRTARRVASNTRAHRFVPQPRAVAEATSTAPPGTAERLALLAASLVDRAGYGDHLRVVARAR